MVEEIKKLGYQPHVMHGVARTVIGAIGDEHSHCDLDVLNAWPQVESVTPIQQRHKLVRREGTQRTPPSTPAASSWAAKKSR